MTKRLILAILAVFITFSVLDALIHGVILMPIYDATMELWRPMDEMMGPLMYISSLVYSACFVLIFHSLIGEKTMKNGVRYGALFGLAVGFTMGFGSYTYLPIPLNLAWGWFLGTWVEAMVAGAVVGAILKAKEAVD